MALTCAKVHMWRTASGAKICFLLRLKRSVVLPSCYILQACWPAGFLILLIGMLGVRCMCDVTSIFSVDSRSELRSSELYGKGFYPLSHVLSFPSIFIFKNK